MPSREGALRSIAALVACLLAAPSPADDPTARGFDPDTARPALSLDGGLVVETAKKAATGTWSGGLLLDYAEGLLALRLAGERDQLLRSRFTAHLLGGYALGRVELGAALPVVLHQRADFSLLRAHGVTGPLLDGVAATALGDLRLFGKLPLVSEEDAPLGLAALLDLRLPTGNKQAFAGDGLAAVPGLVVSRTLGRLRLDGQVGYLIRGQGQYAQLVVHDGLTGGLGASLELPGVGVVHRSRLMAELTGGWPRGDDGSTERYRAPLSTRAGLRAFLPRGWSVEVGAGTGLGDAGYGRESWRVFGGVRLGGVRTAPPEPAPAPQPEPQPAAAPPPPAPPEPAAPQAELLDLDRDHDGVPNDQDVCPDVPGSPEMDGCPDRDGDFIPDPEDRCPDEPGPAQNDGCPVQGPVVVIETEKLSLKDSIHFDYDKATIKAESSPVLDAIATLIRDHPELKRIRVEGHTDNRGTAAYNKDLSFRRARSVVAALVKRGIEPGRLLPEGYGFDRPVADNKTALGRAKNRRVEFTILDEKP